MTKVIGIQHRLKDSIRNFEKICGLGNRIVISKSNGYNCLSYFNNCIPKPVHSSSRYIYECYDVQNAIPTLSFAFMFLDEQNNMLPVEEHKVAFSYCLDSRKSSDLKPIQSPFFTIEEAKPLLRKFNKALSEIKEVKKVLTTLDIIQVSHDFFFEGDSLPVSEHEDKFEDAIELVNETIKAHETAFKDYKQTQKAYNLEVKESEEAILVAELEKQLTIAKEALSKKRKELSHKHDFECKTKYFHSQKLALKNARFNLTSVVNQYFPNNHEKSIKLNEAIQLLHEKFLEK